MQVSGKILVIKEKNQPLNFSVLSSVHVLSFVDEILNTLSQGDIAAPVKGPVRKKRGGNKRLLSK